VPLITRTLLFLFCLILGIVSLDAQSMRDAPVSELQRKFLRMEQRALDLSKRLSEMSGTEPIQLIERNESLEPVELETDAQLSYDELPGPIIEPLPLPVEDPSPELPMVYQSQVTHVAPTTQQKKGDYYLMPMLGFSLSSYIAYEFNQGGTTFSDDLDGGWGNSIGIMLGKRWDNWTAFCRVGYQFQKYDNDNFGSIVPGTFAEIEASNESYLLNLGSGYSIPLSTSLSTYGNVGIGFAYRKDSVEGELYRLIGGSRLDLGSVSDFESSLVFTYDFSMGLEYLFVNNFSARFGYRLLGLTSNESFEGSFQHLIELGVGANF
jgi:opacity protein-like surface antigen